MEGKQFTLLFFGRFEEKFLCFLEIAEKDHYGFWQSFRYKHVVKCDGMAKLALIDIINPLSRFLIA